VHEHNIAQPEVLGVSNDITQILDRTGRVVARQGHGGTFTSWPQLWRHLKAFFPEDRYHFGRQLVDVTQDDAQVTATFADGSVESADLLVGADGYRSFVRRGIAPASEPVYAGYVAYRGLIPESEMSEAEVKFFDGKLTLLPYEHSQIIAYMIPGSDGNLERGRRLFNWAWGVNHSPGELAELMVDRTGTPRDFSVPPGWMNPESISRLRERGHRDLPDVFSSLVDRTRDPFVQAIVDLSVPRMAVGRTAILGDAAFVVRPHTSSGTAKAYRDAIGLADALHFHGRDLRAALDHWQAERMRAARQLADYGIVTAMHAGFGVE
jgi:2-polyprenyl-6-methoxyphenol hydroxylase-like FAD-dependent oxidoreductase